MIKNYLSIAWRNIKRNKVNSFINIAGLAIGMTCVLLILLFVQDEKKFDRFLNQADRIYQVNLENTDNGVVSLTGNTGPAVGPAMVSDFGEIETYARVYRPGDQMVINSDGSRVENYFTEKRILAVDSTFLQVFSYQIREGNPLHCLDKPNSAIITKKIAQKYFDNVSPMGKTLLVGNEKNPYIVTAVLEDVPSQSSLQFDILLPIAAFPVVKKRSWNWWWLQVNTYVKLKKDVPNDEEAIQKLESGFPAMVKQHAFSRNSITYEEFSKKGNKLTYHLQPLTALHLYADKMQTNARLTNLSDIKYIRIFSLIAIFIIVLACVNFMNLSTAQSAKRAKEVGIRKVLGSIKGQMVRQFLVEALLYSFIATIFSLFLVLILLEPFNSITGKELGIGLLLKQRFWLFIAGLFLVTGLLAGLYPAFYLTAFKPVAVLKGMKLFRKGKGNLIVRNGLVIFQFTISTALIVATIVVYHQLQYTRSKDLGYAKENIVVIANSERLAAGMESFRDELKKLPTISDASVTTGIPIEDNFGDVYVPVASDSSEPLIKEIGLSSFMVDNEFIPSIGIRIEAGRNFSPEFSDSASVILNEEAVKQIGWKNPVGMTLDYPGNSQSFKVIGVARDFNFGSLRTAVTPFALFHLKSNTYSVGHMFTIVKMKPGKISDNLSIIEKYWKKFAPNTPFDYSFLDSDLDALYRSEKRMGTIFILFTSLSIFVACLGLFGLAAFMAERRTKEIGVRKVLGASVTGVVGLLSKDFVKLVLISALIAFPVAWWAMNKWLQDFAYRIHIEWWMFLAAGLTALFIALITVSFQAIKAAIVNPVRSLRTE